MLYWSYTAAAAIAIIAYIQGVPRWRPHHRQELAILRSVGANP